ncbi:hypothetical protein CMV_013230 [Castanea mollissima]|uniref:Endonuclease/exonuclease/phosphatase domain-containing protein n=1 Tax=Castanea mollissima TaxID=60419 RepID=A0A8J4VM38_9ROSI|nr:hypothetical protein CMV_013230 [Castanea mollissima]
MRIMSWNCKGLGKSSAILQCKKKALDLKPDFLFLMETRLFSDKRKEVWEKCGFSKGWEVPRVGLSGGLILAWVPKQELRVVFDSQNIIHINLLDDRGRPLSITFVYGHPNHSKRGVVWQQLKSMKQWAHPSWLCIGDFNQILNKEEKFSFKNGNILGAEEFQQVLRDLHLCDLSASGQRFTWINNREEENFVMERLDRAFGVEWVNQYPFYSLKNLPIIRSDHGPILLDLEVQTPFRNRPFRFELMWLTHEDCKEMVYHAWDLQSIGSRATYKASLSSSQPPRRSNSRSPNTRQQPTARDWNLIIKVATTKNRRQCRYGIVYEALTLHGENVFFGVASTTARTATGALLEAVIEAGLAAKAQGFPNVLFITDSKRLMQTIKKECVMDWMDSTRLADYCFLTQNGLFCDVFWVPHVIVKDIWFVAKVATQMPQHYYYQFLAGLL